LKVIEGKENEGVWNEVVRLDPIIEDAVRVVFERWGTGQFNSMAVQSECTGGSPEISSSVHQPNEYPIYVLGGYKVVTIGY